MTIASITEVHKAALVNLSASSELYRRVMHTAEASPVVGAGTDSTLGATTTSATTTSSTSNKSRSRFFFKTHKCVA